MHGTIDTPQNSSDYRAPTQPLSWRALIFSVFVLLSGCANGDFGRVKPSLVKDSIHDWVGTEAPGRQGRPPSQFPLTDAERQLRDFAYPLIEPPYDRQRWFAVLAEYNMAGLFFDGPYPDRRAYSDKLLSTP